MYIQYDLRPTRLTVHLPIIDSWRRSSKPQPPQSYKEHLEGGGKSGLYCSHGDGLKKVQALGFDVLGNASGYVRNSVMYNFCFSYCTAFFRVVKIVG
jgi:hypothetical protein